jgi:hypothetical protein
VLNPLVGWSITSHNKGNLFFLFFMNMLGGQTEG